MNLHEESMELDPGVHGATDQPVAEVRGGRLFQATTSPPFLGSRRSAIAADKELLIICCYI